MARTPKSLARGQLATTGLTLIYTTPAGINTPLKVLSITNTTTVSLQIDVYASDGTTDFLQARVTLPAGIGQRRRFYTFDQDVLNAGETVKLQADSASAFNYSLGGAEVEL